MTRTKLATSIALAALVVVALAPAASAAGSAGGDHKEYEEGTIAVDLFYGFNEGFVLFTGITPSEYCHGAGSPTVPAKVSERGDGTTTVKSHGRQYVEMFLYEFDGAAPDLIDATCAAIFDGDPSTSPLEPVGVGTGRVRVKHSGMDGLDAAGGFHIANSVWGKVTGEDGSRWTVRGHADFDLGDDGFPIGDPADFQGLTVRQLRSCK